MSSVTYFNKLANQSLPLHQRINYGFNEPYWRGPFTLIDAVRAFRRVWRNIDRDLNDVARCDHQFDAGELSDAYYDTQREVKFEYTTAFVAKRFGFSKDELGRAIRVDANERQACWQDAQELATLRKELDEASISLDLAEVAYHEASDNIDYWIAEIARLERRVRQLEAQHAAHR